jgi:hypothetical protein
LGPADCPRRELSRTAPLVLVYDCEGMEARVVAERAALNVRVEIAVQTAKQPGGDTRKSSVAEMRLRRQRMATQDLATPPAATGTML